MNAFVLMEAFLQGGAWKNPPLLCV